MSKTFRIFAAEFELHLKSNVFMAVQTTTYQYFTTGLTSVGGYDAL